jgi:HD superfamily phosphodiesterase
VTDRQLTVLSDWFTQYVDTFISTDDRIRAMIDLKLVHSRNVSATSHEIAIELGWSDGDIHTVAAAGILHDVGRFPQIRDHGTFADHESIDHGTLGGEVLTDSGILGDLDIRDRDSVLTSVRYHNKRTIPDMVPDDTLPIVRLLRDADKLDIYRILQEMLAQENLTRHIQSSISLRGNDEISPAVINDFSSGATVEYRNITTLADFRVMQLSWCYDISYAPTAQRIIDRGIPELIIGSLPDTPALASAIDAARARLASLTTDGA